MKVNIRGLPKDASGSNAATRATHSTHATHIIGDRSSICIDVDKENSNSNCSNVFSAVNEKIMPLHSSLHKPSCSNISSRAKVTGEFLNSNGNDQTKPANILNAKAKAPLKLVLTQTLFSRSSQAATPSTSNLSSCPDDIVTISEVKNESSNKNNSKSNSAIEICNSANNNSNSASFQIEGRDKNSILDDAACLPKKILSENNDQQQQIAQKLQKRIREQDGMICKLNGQIGRHNNNLQESKLQLTKAISELKIKDDEISSLKSNVRSADGHVTLMRYRINKLNNSSNNSSASKYEDTLGVDNYESNETEDHETNIKSRIYLTAGMKEVDTVNGGVDDYDFLLSQVQFYWIHHYRKLSKVLSSIRGECLASNSHINIASSEIEQLDLDPLNGDASFPDVAMANGSQKSAARCATMDPQSDNYLGRQNGIRVDIFSSEYGAMSSLTPQRGGDDSHNHNHNSHNHLENHKEKEEEPRQLTAMKRSEKVDEVSDTRVLSNIDVLQLPRMETHSPTLLKKLLATWPTSSSGSSASSTLSTSSFLSVSPSPSLPTPSVISTTFFSNSLLQTSKPAVPTTQLSANAPTLFDRIASLPDFKSSENSFSHYESANSSFDLNCSIGSSNFSFITQDPGVSSKPLVISLMGTPNAFKVHISKLRQENELAKAEINKFKDILDKYRSL